jgi:hypothetical protein
MDAATVIPTTVRLFMTVKPHLSAWWGPRAGPAVEDRDRDPATLPAEAPLDPGGQAQR